MTGKYKFLNIYLMNQVCKLLIDSVRWEKSQTKAYKYFKFHKSNMIARLLLFYLILKSKYLLSNYFI